MLCENFNVCCEVKFILDTIEILVLVHGHLCCAPLYIYCWDLLITQLMVVYVLQATCSLMLESLRRQFYSFLCSIFVLVLTLNTSPVHVSQF